MAGWRVISSVWKNGAFSTEQNLHHSKSINWTQTVKLITSFRILRMLFVSDCSYNFSYSSRVLQNTDVNVQCTYTFLEQQISAALILNSAQEFRHWLLTMVQFLLQQGRYCSLMKIVYGKRKYILHLVYWYTLCAGEPRRLRLICEELLGPFHKHAKDPGEILVCIFFPSGRIRVLLT